MALKYGFKEWAAICEALAQGKQALILRKGGIAEPSGAFEIEHTRFWLFPTYLHQDKNGLQEEAWPLLERAEAQRPKAGIVPLSHFAEVTGIYRILDLPLALVLQHLHLWSKETVARRFAYRVPGLLVLVVRVWRVPQVIELPDTEYYQGCRSWVELERELPTEGARPVLSEEDLQDVHRQLDVLLNPTALA
jgi:hypothetical protein